jgi:hypothetical protein
MIRANASFLRGELKSTPYHAESIDTETGPLVNDLLALHRRGFFTTEGQPAMNIQGVYIDKVRTTASGRQSRGWFIDTEQKPYLDFYVPKTKRYIDMVEHMLNHPLMYKMMVSDAVAKQTKSNIGLKKYNVTRDRSATHLKDLKSTPWRRYTNLNPTLFGPRRIYDAYPKLKNILDKKSLRVIVALPHYGKGDLLTELLKLADRFGIEPIYQITSVAPGNATTMRSSTMSRRSIPTGLRTNKRMSK